MTQNEQVAIIHKGINPSNPHQTRKQKHNILAGGCSAVEHLNTTLKIAGGLMVWFESPPSPTAQSNLPHRVRKVAITMSFQTKGITRFGHSKRKDLNTASKGPVSHCLKTSDTRRMEIKQKKHEITFCFSKALLSKWCWLYDQFTAMGH